MFNSKILLLQRDYNAGIKDPGCWQLPGGGVEENETPDEAIRRELKEEIDIVPAELNFLISPSEDIHVYYARLTENEAENVRRGNEGIDLRFFSFEELANIPLTTKLKGTINLHGETLKSLLV